MSRATVEAFEFYNFRQAPLKATVQDLETAFPADAFPYQMGYSAVARLATRAGGPASMRRFCELRNLGRLDWKTAFEAAFGTSVAAYYADFEAWRKLP